MSDTFDEEEERATEAMSVPWGSGGRSLEDFDPDTFDVSAAVASGAAASPDEELTADEEEDPFGHLSTGTELGGRYRLVRILGRGACGVVFEAEHLVIGKRVAVKCLYPMLRSHPVQVERFFREARIAATVDHPNVIKVFDGGDDADTLFLAMELLDGETLGARLERGALGLEEARELFLKLMDGVAAMHDKGVVHRDLKPDNVFLTVRKDGSEGEPKVLDFGISKLKEPGRGDITALGTIMGTPFYMAPEQMMNAKGVDRRADVYSIGVMLYEALSGQLPYDGENIADIFSAARAARWTPLHELAPHVSVELSELVATAMRLDPDERPATMRALRRAIEGAPFGSGIAEGATLEAAAPPARPLRSTPARPPAPRAAAPAPEPAMPNPLSASELGDLATRALDRPPAVAAPAEVPLPGWAIAAMVALALLALASLGVAIVALTIL